MSAEGRLRAAFSLVLLFATVCVSAAVGALMLSAHVPFRADADALARLAGRAGPLAQRWQATYILAAGCLCSRRVAEHLIERGRRAELDESVVLVGESPDIEARLRRANMRVSGISANEAADQYQLRGAPWLIFHSPDGRVRYAGGYSAERNARDGYQDMRIWEALQRGEVVAAYPAFGCAIAQPIRGTD